MSEPTRMMFPDLPIEIGGSGGFGSDGASGAGGAGGAGGALGAGGRVDAPRRRTGFIDSSLAALSGETGLNSSTSCAYAGEIRIRTSRSMGPLVGHDPAARAAECETLSAVAPA